MLGWRKVSIQDVAETLSGGTPSRSKSDYYNGTIPWLKTGELGPKYVYDTEEKISEIALKESSAKLIPENSVIVAMYGATIGKLSINKQKMACNQACCAIIPKKELNHEFLYYSLDFRKNDLIKMGSGAAQPNISQEIIRNYVINVPPIQEQQKIADILSTWDKAIELKEKLIEQKKEQKKGLMQRLLTGKVRLPGFKEDWKEVSLDKVVKKTKGQALVYVEGGKYPAIDMDYIETGSFRNYSNDATVIAKKTDVLLLWDGSRAGKAITGVEGSVGSTFVKLECKHINNVFLQKHLEMNEAKIRRLCEGSGIPHVPKDFLHYYKINLPSIEEQKAIAQILDCIDREIEMNEKELNKLKQQKKGLMQLLLTGKVRVKC